jgi:hypothetical protein
MYPDGLNCSHAWNMLNAILYSFFKGKVGACWTCNSIFGSIFNGTQGEIMNYQMFHSVHQEVSQTGCTCQTIGMSLKKMTT